MYKKLNDKYNNMALFFNEIINKIAWQIPFKKLERILGINLG